MEKISVFYRPEQSCDVDVGYSPSAGKPAMVVADWLSRPDIAESIQIETFTPATDAILCSAHDPSYVQGVLSGEIANGFGTVDARVVDSLRYTVGSMVAACKYVTSQPIDGQFNVAISPTSGFHHAGHDFGSGYCTFNGLMAAAIRVHTLRLAKKILILDMDNHFGNGTQDIIDKLGIGYITHITAGSGYRTAKEALSAAWHVGRFDKRHYDLVIYQAGADIHVNDPLGGILTTEQMLERDRNVFASCWASITPLVWNLAGGYAKDEKGTIEPVLALHRQTIQACITEFKRRKYDQ